MDSKMRFRNHFSIVFQHMKGIFWVFVMPLFSGIAGGDAEEVLASVLVWLTFGVMFVIWRIIIWSKTWITIGQQTIVMECNTLFSKKKHTIGIANISNVNLEQGLFGMMLGTCKLKLDTNSLSTAETTDVTIVLKKVKAEEVKSVLLRQIEGEVEAVLDAVAEATEAVKAQAQAQWQVPDYGQKEIQESVSKRTRSSIRISTQDILLHGVYASNFVYAIFVPLFILIELATEFIGEGDLDAVIDEIGAVAAETIGLGLLIFIAIGSWALLAMIFSLVRNAIRCWDFQIERQKNKLVLSYGLTKKVNYAIPVDKIQAVVFKQSMLARLCKRYMVEVVNVGMNDDEKEVQAFLLPYSKRSVLEQELHDLLPEFAHCLELKAERQPKSVWLVWIWPAFVYLLIAGAVLGAIAEFAPKALLVACIVIAVLSVWILAVRLVAYLTEGTGFGEEVLLSVTGSFARQFVFMKYDKIQYVQLKQNFIARRFGIQKGVGFLLASMQNQAQEIPYFIQDKVKNLKRVL